MVPVAPAESLSVETTGRGDPVVLIPGLFGSAFGFRKLVPLLVDAGYRTIVIEPLGVGASARPEKANYSLTAQADRIAAVLDSLHVRSALVLAHSIGGNAVGLSGERVVRLLGAGGGSRPCCNGAVGRGGCPPPGEGELPAHRSGRRHCRRAGFAPRAQRLGPGAFDRRQRGRPGR